MQVYCAIRRLWVAATPEEMVRQRLLLKLVQQLGFSPAHIAVEVSLKQLSHLAPTRRADILCYFNTPKGLSPLLLIECKAVPLNDQVLRQIMGYNRYVQAHFVAVANQNEEKIGSWDALQQEYAFSEGLPSLASLCEKINQADKPVLLPR